MERNKILIQTAYDSITAIIEAFETGRVEYVSSDTDKAVDKLLEAQMWLGYAVSKVPKAKPETKAKKPDTKSKEDIAKETEETYRRMISKLKDLDHISLFTEFFEL